MPEALPPQNIEAEEAVIGSILIDGNVINDVNPVIKPESFSRESHAVIFKVMVDLHDKGEPIDQITVAHALEAEGQLENIGGREFLAQLTNAVAFTINAKTYAEKVKDTALGREIIRAGEQISDIGYESSKNVSESLSKAEEIIYSIRSQQEDTGDFKHLKTALQPYWTLSKADVNKEDRIMTGFDEIDELLYGLHRSDMIVLAARPSVGKSALALNIALNVAEANYKVAIFTFEMNIEAVAARLVACMSGIPIDKLRACMAGIPIDKLPDGRGISDSEQRIINSAVGRLQDFEIHVSDTMFQQVADIRDKAHRLKKKHGVDFIVVDYMQRIDGGQGRWQDNRPQQVSEISRYLKSMAHDLDVPVLALSQLNRAIEKRDSPLPQLSDLRESGSIEQDADVVIFIHREDKLSDAEERWNQARKGKPFPRGVAELHVLKHRHGKTAKLKLGVRDNIGRFGTLGTLPTKDSKNEDVSVNPQAE